MNLWDLNPGDRISTRDGAVAEVVSPTEDGEWVKVRYVECADDPSIVGTEDLAHDDEMESLVEAGSDG